MRNDLNVSDIIDEVASEEDIASFKKGSFGKTVGFGKTPALLVVDMTNEFVDPKYPNASGDMCLKASHSISGLLKVARAK